MKTDDLVVQGEGDVPVDPMRQGGDLCDAGDGRLIPVGLRQLERPDERCQLFVGQARAPVLRVQCDPLVFCGHESRGLLDRFKAVQLERCSRTCRHGDQPILPRCVAILLLERGQVGRPTPDKGAGQAGQSGDQRNPEVGVQGLTEDALGYTTSARDVRNVGTCDPYS
jgi:hypothetical protein